MTDLAARVRAAAVLEGDFLLRSGRRSRFYVDKYRFGTRPDLLAEIGDALAERIAEVEPGATRIAAPEVGAIALAAAASLRSGLPFVIVRKAAKEYGTTKRLEGVYEPGERIVVVEDVVTSRRCRDRLRARAARGRPQLRDRDLRRRPRGGRRRCHGG